MKINVLVTELDIKRGRKKDPLRDPIAWALFRSLGQKASVTDRAFRLYAGPHPERLHQLPLQVVRFMREFETKDDPGQFEPFSFELELDRDNFQGRPGWNRRRS